MEAKLTKTMKSSFTLFFTLIATFRLIRVQVKAPYLLLAQKSMAMSFNSVMLSKFLSAVSIGMSKYRAVAAIMASGSFSLCAYISVLVICYISGNSSTTKQFSRSQLISRLSSVESPFLANNSSTVMTETQVYFAQMFRHFNPFSSFEFGFVSILGSNYMIGNNLLSIHNL